MKTSTLFFVFLEWLIGLGFAIAGAFMFTEYDKSSGIMTGIFYMFVVGFVSMFVGIVLIGYFHLRTKRLLNKFGWALFYTFIGIFLSALLYILIQSLLPDLGMLAIIMPLTGGVMGFNWALKND